MPMEMPISRPSKRLLDAQPMSIMDALHQVQIPSGQSRVLSHVDVQLFVAYTPSERGAAGQAASRH